MSTEANQPAFPVTTYNTYGEINNIHLGMSKREYFAGLAMHGILASLEGDLNKYTVNGGFLHGESVAEDAIMCADALIKELSKP
jgi:hypothetical protein